MQQDNNKKIGFIGTVIFHVAAVIIMFLFGLLPHCLSRRGGILINFGVDDAGSGDIETQFSPSVAMVETQPQVSNPVVETSDDNEKEYLLKITRNRCDGRKEEER